MPEFLSKFSVDLPYKLILYVATLVFVLSFFFPVYGVELTTLRRKSVAIIGGGLIVWFISLIVKFIMTREDAEDLEGLAFSALKVSEGAYLFFTFVTLSLSAFP